LRGHFFSVLENLYAWRLLWRKVIQINTVFTFSAEDSVLWHSKGKFRFGSALSFRFLFDNSSCRHTRQWTQQPHSEYINTQTYVKIVHTETNTHLCARFCINRTSRSLFVFGFIVFGLHDVAFQQATYMTCAIPST
jgi:hypothetical protein